MEEKQADTESELGSFIGGNIAGSAFALVALIEALAEQPGIDAESLVKDFMERLPARGSASPGAELIYDSIEGLLRSDSEPEEAPPPQTA